MLKIKVSNLEPIATWCRTVPVSRMSAMMCRRHQTLGVTQKLHDIALVENVQDEMVRY